MKTAIAAFTVFLATFAGCGGNDSGDPVRLDGPATLSSVTECLEKTGLFSDLEAEKDPIFDPVELGIGDGPATQIPTMIFGYWRDDGVADDERLQFSVVFYDSAEIAEQMTSIESLNEDLIQIISDTPHIGIDYNREIPDEGYEAMRLCTKEDF